ncbi:hypothetical protein TEA_028105 [Camellia sinensis var. sinensis]|uniref:Thiolase N-terminal domain-containing protein n=1 Tax=Camellia sinensis var. sinensis TaxID=542762 RepID=A0A4S4DCP9_CAMSN|nr:hypothetical protein TEA_028105 [Camellia sinensis var. sinensis]
MAEIRNIYFLSRAEFDNTIRDFPHDFKSYVKNHQLFCQRGKCKYGRVFCSVEDDPRESRTSSSASLLRFGKSKKLGASVYLQLDTNLFALIRSMKNFVGNTDFAQSVGPIEMLHARSSYIEDNVYMIESFLPPNYTEGVDPRIALVLLLTTMKRHCESFKVASGEELGEDLSIEVLDFSEDVSRSIVKRACKNIISHSGHLARKVRITNCFPVNLSKYLTFSAAFLIDNVCQFVHGCVAPASLLPTWVVSYNLVVLTSIPSKFVYLWICIVNFDFFAGVGHFVACGIGLVLWVNTPKGMAWFRGEYNMQKDVTLTLARPSAERKGTKNTTAFTIACIVEVGATYYIRAKSLAYQLVTNFPDIDKHGDDFFFRKGCFKRRKTLENRTAIKTTLSYEKHSPSELLGYEPAYEPESNEEIEVGQVGTSSAAVRVPSQSESSKCYTPSPSPTSEGENISRNRVLLDLQAAIFGTDPFPIEKEKGNASAGLKQKVGPNLWEPELKHEGHSIDTNNSVLSLATLPFDLLKALLLSLDMAEHNIQANNDLIKSALQYMVVANQKTHLALGRYEEIEQQLLELRERARLLIAEAVNKDEAQIAELKAKLKLAEDRYWKQVADVAAAIKAGFYDIGKGHLLLEDGLDVKTMAQAQDCLLPMGVTSENVAHRFSVTRQEQDQAAVESHRKAAAATASGKFKEEIIPVDTKIVDPKTGDEKPVTISVDDGIRPNATISDLAKLKPVFKKDGTTTAGNSSQVSDGAGAVLLMKRSIAMQKGLPILGVFRTFAAVGVDPAIMGVGPSVAIPAAVKAAGLELDDIDLFEINEAFASQFVYCRKKLELDPEKINVNGGAMAIGHPLGATGTGMGAAAVFERGDSVDDLCNARKIGTNNFLSKDAQ